MSVRRANKRKSALIQSQAFRAWVLESMDSGVVIFNAAGRLQTINRKAREILKMPEEAPSSINGFEKSLGKTQLGKIMELVRALDRENRDVLQDELDIEIGEEKRRILVTAERVRDNQGHILGRAVSLKDVTDLVRSRDVLAWANLARRLTHEVKTPLASMLLAAERLESTFKSKETPEPEKVKEYLSYLFREIERLRTLSEAMLQLTDIEKKEQTKIDLNRIVREAVDQSSPLLREEVDIEVEVAPEPIFLLGNFRQVLLVVTNILRNAIQSIEKQGKIRIATSVAQGLQGVSETGASSFAVLEVNDTGAGIPESARANIFDPYFSLRKDGTGLGLAIVKKIVEDMNGKIEFHSEEGLGTTFWLYFPLYSEEKNKA
jgi:two-component system nitrogen regulation sensor histidine kinase NtrY